MDNKIPSTTVATIVFVDISGFTGCTCENNSDLIFDFLKDFYGIMHPIIEKHGGIINKNVADGIMGFWYSSLPQNFSVVNAVNCALEIKYKFRDFMKQYENKHGFNHIKGLKVGVNTGLCTAGPLGSYIQKSYTIIGHDVNLASRLMNISNEFCGNREILIGQNTWKELENLRVTDNYMSCPKMVNVKGIPKPIVAYKISFKNEY